MTSPQRIRVLTPEALDAAAANLVNTANTQLRAAVSQYAGTSTQNGTTGVSTATPNAIIARDGNARAQVATPSASGDIATKGYVDTTVGGYIPTTAKGAVSGVASLDSNGLVTVGQLPTFLNRYLGSGTSFPSARAGDKYTRTDVGCMFAYDGTSWWQDSPCTVATRAARNALSTSLSSVLHPGFVVTQADRGYRWRWDGTWTFANFLTSNVFGDTGSVDASPSMKYTRKNYAIPSSGVTFTSGWVVETMNSTHGVSREWISTDGQTFTLQDRMHLAIQAYCFSDVPAQGYSSVVLNVPGGSLTMPTGTIVNESQRGAGYAGSGTLQQAVEWTGYANPGSFFSLSVQQNNTNNQDVTYHFYLNVSALPG